MTQIRNQKIKIITLKDILNDLEIKGFGEYMDAVMNEDLILQPQDIRRNSRLRFGLITFDGRIEITNSENQLTLAFVTCEINQSIDFHGGNIDLNVSKSLLKEMMSYYGESDYQSSISFVQTQILTVTFYSGIIKRVFLNNLKKINDHATGFQFMGITFNDWFRAGGDFELPLSFQQCQFNEPANFNSIPDKVTSFDSIQCMFSTFEKRVIFNYAHACELEFSNVKFKDDVSFAEVVSIGTVASQLKFQRCAFDKSTDFHSLKCNAAIYEWCTFSETVTFSNSKIRKLILSHSFFAKSCNFLSIDLQQADRETFRIIKNEFIKLNNRIDSLEYQKREMEAYEKEISYKNKTADRLILFLSKWSNYYGLNWLRGVVFTSTICFISFFIYQYSLENNPVTFGWNSFEDFKEATSLYSKFLFQFWLPTHAIDFMKDYDPTGWSYCIDIIARILIAYGIVQTVAAFRKFGKVD